MVEYEFYIKTEVKIHTDPPALATIVHVFALQAEFYQEVNDTQYSLKNGGLNALAVWFSPHRTLVHFYK